MHSHNFYEIVIEKMEWINTNDNEKKLACIQLCKKMSFERNDHTCKNALLVLNFCIAILFKRFFFFFFFPFSFGLFRSHSYIPKNWNVMVIVVAFLCSCDNCTVFKKIGYGVEFPVTNAMAFLCSSKILNATHAIWSLEKKEWVIFALASAQMSLPNW